MIDKILDELEKMNLTQEQWEIVITKILKKQIELTDEQLIRIKKIILRKINDDNYNFERKKYE